MSSPTSATPEFQTLLLPTSCTWPYICTFPAPRRSDVVPHLSYASVETLLVEASDASPVRQWVTQAGSAVAEVRGGEVGWGSGV